MCTFRVMNLAVDMWYDCIVCWGGKHFEAIQGLSKLDNIYDNNQKVQSTACAAGLEINLFQCLTFRPCLSWSFPHRHLLDRLLDDLTSFRHILLGDGQRRYESKRVVDGGREH